MANTTNYNWETPDDTDLVKDGAAAIRTLGNSIDTTTKNLNPETTTGDIAYRSATANTNTRLPIGTNGQILAVSAGVPAWINNDQGDITEVQAGTGISVASGTGPIPIVTNTVATAIDAKGDLIVGTGADTFARLAVGTNGHTLVADSSVSPTGLKWAAPAGGGKVLQVVSGTYATQVTNSTNTFADTSLTASITPSAATSKVLVLIAQSVQQDGDGTGEIYMKMLRDATQLGTDQPLLYTGTNIFKSAFFSACYLDSPSSTSALTYKTQIKAYAGNGRANIGGGTSQITLLEIGA